MARRNNQITRVQSVLKQEYKSFETVSEAIVIDDSLNYINVPATNPEIIKIRGWDESKEELPSYWYVPVNGVQEHLSGSPTIYILDYQQLKAVRRYKEDLQFQAFDTSMMNVSANDPIPLTGVYSQRYAPLNLGRVYGHLVDPNLLGKPMMEKSYHNLGILVMWEKMATYRNRGAHSIFARSQWQQYDIRASEPVHYHPVALFSYNFGNASLKCGWIGRIPRCMNEIYFLGKGASRFLSGDGNKGYIMHTKNIIKSLDLNDWTDAWLSSLKSLQELVLVAMETPISYIDEIMCYVRASNQSITLLRELFTRPQGIDPKNWWDIAMNITRVGSPEYKWRTIDNISQTKLYESSVDVANILTNPPKFTFTDYLSALKMVDKYWQSLDEFGHLMKVNIKDFYYHVADQVMEQAAELDWTGTPLLSTPKEDAEAQPTIED